MAIMAKPQKPTQPETVSVDEAAAEIGVVRETVIRMLRRGELRGYKKTFGLTAPYRVYKSSLTEFLRKRETSDDKK